MGLRGGDAGPDVPVLAVRFPPIWSHIAPLATYIGAVLEVQKRADAADRVAIVAHELLENAVKYGDPASEVKLDVFTAGQSLIIRVTNKAHPSRIGILEREVRRNRATTPQEAFTKALERLQHLPEGSTMLGLSRVGLEANLAIETLGGLVVATATIDTNAARAGALNANKVPVNQPGRNEAGPESRMLDRTGSNISQTRRVDGTKSGSSQSNSTLGAVGNGDPSRGSNRR